MRNKKVYLDAGELTARSFTDYHGTCTRLIQFFTEHRLVLDVATDDFEQLRAGLAKTRGPVALGNEINRVRIVFKWGFDASNIRSPFFCRSCLRTFLLGSSTVGHDRRFKSAGSLYLGFGAILAFGVIAWLLDSLF